MLCAPYNVMHNDQCVIFNLSPTPIKATIEESARVHLHLCPYTRPFSTQMNSEVAYERTAGVYGVRVRACHFVRAFGLCKSELLWESQCDVWELFWVIELKCSRKLARSRLQGERAAVQAVQSHDCYRIDLNTSNNLGAQKHIKKQHSVAYTTIKLRRSFNSRHKSKVFLMCS